MILVPCPYCGPRNASEFRWCGELRERPDPATATPAQWRRYLYMRRNVAGFSRENWFHRAGCGRYFALERNTVTNQFRAAAADAAIETSTEPAGQIQNDGSVRPPGGK
jgi:heterotetrameric sarcosine oxidase delta subunit